jgi:hypothetical protein
LLENKDKAEKIYICPKDFKLKSSKLVRKAGNQSCWLCKSKINNKKKDNCPANYQGAKLSKSGKKKCVYKVRPNKKSDTIVMDGKTYKTPDGMDDDGENDSDLD